MDTYTITEYSPVDGTFFLIHQDGRMMAKTWNRPDAERIVAALKPSHVPAGLGDLVDQITEALECLPVGDVDRNVGFAALKQIVQLHTDLCKSVTRAERNCELLKHKIGGLLAASIDALEQMRQLEKNLRDDAEFVSATVSLSAAINRAKALPNPRGSAEQETGQSTLHQLLKEAIEDMEFVEAAPGTWLARAREAIKA